MPKDLKTQLLALCEGFDVEDLILFGSKVKGKPFPRDVDVLVVVNEGDVRKKAGLETSLRQAGFDAVVVSPRQLFSERLLLASVLHEGQSLIHNSKPLVKAWVFFLFRLPKLTKSQRNSFNYALKTHLRESEGFHLAPGVIAVPVGMSELLKALMEHWKADFSIVATFLSFNSEQAMASFAVDRKQMMEKQAEASR